jgi:hypothetical protein
LVCARCEITDLPELPQNLKYLDVNTNKISILKIKGELEYLDCSSNKLEKLPNIPINGILNCSSNLITEIDTTKMNLTELDIRFNLLSELPTITDRLEKLYVANNQILIDDIENFKVNLKNIKSTDMQDLDIFKSGEANLKNNKKLLKNLMDKNIQMNDIYQNPQNAHDEYVMASLKKSITYLYNLPCLDEQSVLQRAIESGIDMKELNMEFGRVGIFTLDEEKDIYVSFLDIFCMVWSLIDTWDTDTRIEIVKIINKMLYDIRGVCDEGAYEALVGVLCGFDKNIVLNISERASANAIYNVVLKHITEKYKDISAEEKYKLVKTEMTKELTEREFSQKIIDEWTNF